MTKYKFILLCGPTGSGKGSVPEKLAELKPGEFKKIEKDEYVTESKFYKTIISQIIEGLGIDKIIAIINGNDTKKKKDLTDLFNAIYFNASQNAITCDTNFKDLNCAQLHDKKLGEQIKINDKHIVLEINGDKDYSWIFYNTEEASKTSYFNKTHSEKLLKDYDIEIYYLSGDFNQLLDDNKDRFIRTLNTCNKDNCETRLGNFLMEEVYKNTIVEIFKTIDNLKDTLFRNENIKVYYFKRVGKNYIPLKDKYSYFMSFNIGDKLTLKEQIYFMSYINSFSEKSRKGGKKKKKRKTKRRKYKKIKTKRR